MSMTPERVAERVAGMIESIRDGSSHSFSDYNVRETLHYVAQVYEIGLITEAQRTELELAIRDAWQKWQPKASKGHLFSDDFR